MSVEIKDKDKGAAALLKRTEKLILERLSNMTLGVHGVEGAVPHGESAPPEAGPPRAKEPDAETHDGSGDTETGELSGGDKLTVADIAEIHEFGLGSVPRRSFLADWAEQSQVLVLQVVTKAAKAVVKETLSVDEAVEQIGAWAVGSIQTRMANGIPPALKPATIKRKGSSVTLIDTGQLRSSITYRIKSDR